MLSTNAKFTTWMFKVNSWTSVQLFIYMWLSTFICLEMMILYYWMQCKEIKQLDLTWPRVFCFQSEGRQWKHLKELTSDAAMHCYELFQRTAQPVIQRKHAQVNQALNVGLSLRHLTTGNLYPTTCHYNFRCGHSDTGEIALLLSSAQQFPE